MGVKGLRVCPLKRKEKEEEKKRKKKEKPRHISSHTAEISLRKAPLDYNAGEKKSEAEWTEKAEITNGSKPRS